MDSISIILPALNEGGIVGKTIKEIPLEKLRALGLEPEVIVVDNGSEDKTAEEAKDAGAKVVFEKEKGYGAAYLRGFQEAKGDIIVIADADGTYPLEIIPEFITPLIYGKKDFVIGSRLRGKIFPGAMSFLHRYIGNPLLTFLLNLFFNIGVSDVHCGMRAFTREALQRMNLKTKGMEFASEMIIEAKRKNLRVTEIPIEYRRRGGGMKKLSSFKDGWRHLRVMMLYSPTILFLIPGGFLFFIGLLLIGLLLGGPIRVPAGNIGLDIHPMILGNLLVILGFQIIILGVFTKVFAVLHGINKAGRFTKIFLKYNSLEYELLLGVILFSIGLLVDIKIILSWIESGFGELAELRSAILASTLMFLGVQLIFSALFLSVLLLERGELK
jgi:glycosyltransferase involved in cell wall biosynthesis